MFRIVTDGDDSSERILQEYMVIQVTRIMKDQVDKEFCQKRTG